MGSLLPSLKPLRFGSRRWLLVVILILVGIGLRFYLLTNQSLWWDEGFSIQNSAGTAWGEVFDQVKNIYHADKFQPLYYWLLFVWRRIFGDSELALRSLSAVIGVATLPVVYLIALRFYGYRHAAWSLALATFSAFLSYYSQEVRNYALLIFLCALQLYCLSEVILLGKKAKPAYWWGHFILIGLGLFGSVQMAVFSAGLSVSHFLANRRWKEWLSWWVPAAIFALPALIYYATLPGEVDPGEVSVSRSNTSLLINIVFVIYGLMVGTTYGPPQENLRGGNKLATVLNHAPELLILALVCLGLFYFLCKALASRSQSHSFRRSDLFFVYLVISSFLFGLLLAMITKMNWLPRHAFYIWVTIPILLPAILYKSAITDQPRGFHGRKLSELLLVVLIGLNVYSLSNYYFNPIYWRDDYRGAASYLLEARETVDNTILMSGELDILKYYGDDSTLYVEDKWVGKLLAGDSGWVEGVKERSTDSVDIVLAIYRPRRYSKANIENDLSDSYSVLSSEDNIIRGFKILRLKAK